MKRIFFLITLLIFLLQAVFSQSFAIEPLKVLGLNYDDASSLVYISTKDEQSEVRDPLALKYVRLENPNRIYFDINDAVLVGPKQQLVFEKSDIKLDRFLTKSRLMLLAFGTSLLFLFMLFFLFVRKHKPSF